MIRPEVKNLKMVVAIAVSIFLLNISLAKAQSIQTCAEMGGQCSSFGCQPGRTSRGITEDCVGLGECCVPTATDGVSTGGAGDTGPITGETKKGCICSGSVSLSSAGQKLASAVLATNGISESQIQAECLKLEGFYSYFACSGARIYVTNVTQDQCNTGQLKQSLMDGFGVSLAAAIFVNEDVSCSWDSVPDGVFAGSLSLSSAGSGASGSGSGSTGSGGGGSSGSVDSSNTTVAPGNVANDPNVMNRIRTEAAQLNRFPAVYSTPQKLIGFAIKILMMFMGSIMFALVFYAGVLWMVAQGNSEKIEKAKNIMVWAALGTLVMLTSYILLNFVISALQSGG